MSRVKEALKGIVDQQKIDNKSTLEAFMDLDR
jgi:hypothetical protein